MAPSEGRSRQTDDDGQESVWPFEAQWEAGGEGQVYYRMTEKQAHMWREAWISDDVEPVEE